MHKQAWKYKSVFWFNSPAELYDLSLVCHVVTKSYRLSFYHSFKHVNLAQNSLGDFLN